MWKLLTFVNCYLVLIATAQNGIIETNNLPPGVPLQDNCINGECVPVNLCRNKSGNNIDESTYNIFFDAVNPLKCHDYMKTCCSRDDIIRTHFTNLPPSSTEFLGCGMRNVDGLFYKMQTASNNYTAGFAEFPWMVGVLRQEIINNNRFYVYQCGGSLIHPQVVLTAAHCVSGQHAYQLSVRAGEWDTQTTAEIYPHQVRDITKVTIHPNYHGDSLINDIALLFLVQPVTFAPNVQTVCLPSQGQYFDFERCFASGWGKDVFGREGKYQVILKKVDLPVVPSAWCESSLKQSPRLSPEFKLHSSFICAGGESGKDTCKGDGGSPLVCHARDTFNQYYQAGIVAWGIGCGEQNLSGVYVNVAMFRNWIDQQMTDNGLDDSFYAIRNDFRF